MCVLHRVAGRHSLRFKLALGIRRPHAARARHHHAHHRPLHRPHPRRVHRATYEGNGRLKISVISMVFQLPLLMDVTNICRLTI